MTDISSFDAVLFDCDGVLVDSESIANRVWTAILAEHGLTLDAHDFLRRSVGTTLTALYEGLALDYRWTRPPTFDADLDARLAAAFEGVPPVPGAAELLAALPIPFCVASNSREDRLHLKLGAAGLAPLLGDRVFHPGLVARGKPAPDLFLHAAAALGAAPARCLVVEDSVLGTRAGVAAGMTVWGFVGASHALPGLAGELRDEGAERVLASLAEVGAALGVRVGV